MWKKKSNTFPKECDFKYKVGDKVYIDHKYRENVSESCEFTIHYICTWYSDGLFYAIRNIENNITFHKVEEKELITIYELRNRKILFIL
jgi:hypothetical protein